MPIPEFRADGWLPEGHHNATWEEISERFSGAVGSQRARVMNLLLDWRARVKGKGIAGKLVLDGSFISAKQNPGDFDAILVYDDHSESILTTDQEASSLIDYTSCKKVGFDLLAFSARAAREYPLWYHTDSFDLDKKTGKAKGVIEVEL